MAPRLLSSLLDCQRSVSWPLAQILTTARLMPLTLALRMWQQRHYAVEFEDTLFSELLLKVKVISTWTSQFSWLCFLQARDP